MFGQPTLGVVGTVDDWNMLRLQLASLLADVRHICVAHNGSPNAIGEMRFVMGGMDSIGMRRLDATFTLVPVATTRDAVACDTT